MGEKPRGKNLGKFTERISLNFPPVLLTVLSTIVDTWAQVNVMPVKVYNSLKTKSKVLQPTKVKLNVYGGNRIPVLGRCQLKCKYKNEAHNLEF